jgi:acetyl-CoA hydrolase
MQIPFMTADEAAAHIQHGDILGIGGFGPAGSPKTLPPAIAARAIKEHAEGRPFKVDVITGASIGSSCDGALTQADAIDR